MDFEFKLELEVDGGMFMFDEGFIDRQEFRCCLEED